MKKEWKKPTLEVLDIKMTMKGHDWDGWPPWDKDNGDGDIPHS